MFVWFSSGNGRSGMGCCGGLLLLPLGFLTLFGGFGGGGLLLILLVVVVLGVMFALPRFMGATVDGEKQKNDEFYDEYAEKPKRDEDQYMLTDDGEIVKMDDDEESTL